MEFDTSSSSSSSSDSDSDVELCKSEVFSKAFEAMKKRLTMAKNSGTNTRSARYSRICQTFDEPADSDEESSDNCEELEDNVHVADNEKVQFFIDKGPAGGSETETGFYTNDHNDGIVFESHSEANDVISFDLSNIEEDIKNQVVDGRPNDKTVEKNTKSQKNKEKKAKKPNR